MASKTPSRPKTRHNTKASAPSSSAAAKHPGAKKRPASRRTAASSAAKATRKGDTAHPAADLKISPAIRKKWEKLTQRWKNLLPKIGKSAKAGPKKNSRRRS